MICSVICQTREGNYIVKGADSDYIRKNYSVIDRFIMNNDNYFIVGGDKDDGL